MRIGMLDALIKRLIALPLDRLAAGLNSQGVFTTTGLLLMAVRLSAPTKP